MKVLALLGSPRTNGNTAVLTNRYLEGIKSKNPDAHIQIVKLNDIEMKGCKGCFACQTGKLKYCVTKDDIQNSLYDKILESDIIVLATPIYTFTMSAQLKIVLDRFFAIANKLSGKKIVSLTTFGDTDRLRAGIDNHLNVIKSLSVFTGMDYIANYDVSTGYIPVNSNPDALNEVYQLGSRVF